MVPSRRSVNGSWPKFFLGLFITAAGALVVWDRQNVKDEIEKLRVEDQALRALIRAHATGDGLIHQDYRERFRALEREVFGKGE